MHIKHDHHLMFLGPRNRQVEEAAAPTVHAGTQRALVLEGPVADREAHLLTYEADERMVVST